MQRDIQAENLEILQGISLRDLLRDPHLGAMDKLYFLYLLDIASKIRPHLEEDYWSQTPGLVPIPYRAFKRYGLTGQGRIITYLRNLKEANWVLKTEWMRDRRRGYGLTGVLINHRRPPVEEEEEERPEEEGMAV